MIPNNSIIDLINVSFAENSPDRLTAISSFEELSRLHPGKIFNLILVDKTMKDVEKNESDFLKIIYPKVRLLLLILDYTYGFQYRNGIKICK